MPDLLICGEALTDFLRTGSDSWVHRSGGACWNIARVAARLGAATAFAGSVSRDCFGDDLAQLSVEAGLDPRFLQRSSAPPLLAMVYQTDPPAYFFSGADAADQDFDFATLPAGWRDSLRWFHTGSLALVREPLASRILATAQELAAAGVTISYDPNYRKAMSAAYRPRLESMLGIASCIKISDEDIAGLLPELDARSGLDWVLERAGVHSPRGAQVLYTRGAEGLVLYQAGEAVAIPAFKVAVADTVGAGDASMGGWIYSQLCRPGQAADHARFAAAAAAVACRHRGAWAPTLDEVEALLE